MANEDGAMDRGEAGHDLPHPPTRKPVPEPTILEKDVPWPPRWERVLGPGGEDLGDGLVPVGAESPPPARPPSGRRSRRRPPTSGESRSLRPDASRRVRRSIPRPEPGKVLAAGVAAGLLGLATLLAVVLFSFDGSPPARQASGSVAALSAPALVGSSAAEWIAASTLLEARVRQSAERQRELARDKRERARRRERERRQAARTPSRPQTIEVVAPSRPATAPADPWPGVSAAEREFTPGPWNLN